VRAPEKAGTESQSACTIPRRRTLEETECAPITEKTRRLYASGSERKESKQCSHQRKKEKGDATRKKIEKGARMATKRRKG